MHENVPNFSERLKNRQCLLPYVKLTQISLGDIQKVVDLYTFGVG